MSITIRQLARIAGVSPATVCLALKNDARVAKSTRDRIAALAAEECYRPLPAVSALASRKWRRDRDIPPEPIAFLHFVGKHFDSNQVELEAAIREGQRLGYAVTEYRIDDWPDARLLDRTLFARGVRGIIVGATPEKWNPDGLDWTRYAVICLGSHFTHEPAFHRVRNNLLHGMTMLLEHIGGLGCRKVCIVLRKASVPPSDFRAQLAAVLLFQKERSRHGVQCLLQIQDANDHARTLRWIEREGPDALIAQDISAYWFLRERGIHPPWNFRFAAVFLGVEEDEWSVPVAGLLQDQAIWGEEAMRLLDQMLFRGEKGIPDHPRELLIPARLKPGASLGEPSNSPTSLGPCVLTKRIFSGSKTGSRAARCEEAPRTGG